MSSPSSTHLKIDVLRLHLSVRWEGFLMPFEQHKALSLLPDQGYVVEEAVTEAPPFTETGGVVARKGATSLSMDPTKPNLGLSNLDAQTLVEEFDIIEDGLRKELSFESSERAAFYEVLYSSAVWTDKNALEVLKKLHPEDPLAAKFAEFAGLGAAASASLRFVPITGRLHSADWWDFVIDPSFRSPEKCYRVSLVFRNPDRGRTIGVTKDIDQIVRSTIDLMEESGE